MCVFVPIVAVCFVYVCVCVFAFEWRTCIHVCVCVYCIRMFVSCECAYMGVFAIVRTSCDVHVGVCQTRVYWMCLAYEPYLCDLSGCVCVCMRVCVLCTVFCACVCLFWCVYLCTCTLCERI